LVSISQSLSVNILKELNLEACFLRSIDNIKMNCRQVSFEDLRWTLPTQYRFQGFCDAVYETVALIIRRFRSDAFVRTAQNIVRFTSSFGRYVAVTQSDWSRP
jgi:hypothetical protein